MKLVKRKPDEGQEMNMTPMIDVVFQLLIFFMLVSDLSQKEKAELVLPRASEATPDEGEPGRHVINIEKDGKIKIGADYVTLDRLNEILKIESEISREGGKKFSDKPILIRADKGAKFETIQKIMGKCVNNQIWKLSFGAMAGPGETEASVKGGDS